MHGDQLGACCGRWWWLDQGGGTVVEGDGWVSESLGSKTQDNTRGFRNIS